MTIIPLWVKALAVAIAIALMGLAIHRLDLSRQDIGYQRAVAVYDKKLLAAQADAKAISDAWIERQRKEREEANERFNARDAAYAAAVWQPRFMAVAGGIFGFARPVARLYLAAPLAQ